MHSFTPPPPLWKVMGVSPLTPQLLHPFNLSQLILFFFFFSFGVAAQTWFMRNIYSLDLQFSFSFPSGIVNVSLGPLILFVPNNYIYFDFLICLTLECTC